MQMSIAARFGGSPVSRTRRNLRLMCRIYGKYPVRTKELDQVRRVVFVSVYKT